MNDSLGDSDADSEESYIEPVLQLDIDHHRRQSAERDFRKNESHKGNKKGFLMHNTKTAILVGIA